ncbi:MAG: hypothetical protein WCS37_09380 [Chloroflexota bacterium]|nr:hypothetical protein [Chloroflexota bacterium]
MQSFNAIFRRVIVGLVGLLVGGLLLAACGDVPIDRVAEINKAVGYTGITPLPTIDPTIRAKEALGFSVVIFGIRDYYPNRPNETINMEIHNERETSIFMSKLCNTLLQHQVSGPNGNSWEDIAYGRACPPTDTLTFQLFPKTAIKAEFTFDRTTPFKGKSWMVPGTYRLMLIYYLRCPDAYNTINTCEDRRYADSNEFQIKLDQLPSPSP